MRTTYLTAAKFVEPQHDLFIVQFHPLYSFNFHCHAFNSHTFAEYETQTIIMRNKFMPINIFISEHLVFIHLHSPPLLVRYVLLSFQAVPCSVVCSTCIVRFEYTSNESACARTDCQTYLCIHKICILYSDMN